MAIAARAVLERDGLRPDQIDRRHPAQRRERYVDERAHRALHGRYPGQE